MRGFSYTTRAIFSFIHFIERRLGAEFLYDKSRINYESLELLELFELVEKLRRIGIIRSYHRTPKLPDEPRTMGWGIEYAIEDNQYHQAGGGSADDEPLALTKALAEAIERNAWFTFEDFKKITRAITADIAKKENFLNPESFSGYTKEQRRRDSRLSLSSSDQFTWVSGYSWTRKAPIWIPVQIVSGKRNFRAHSPSSGEPAIRASITTGIATHPVRIQALLSGALEVIERDAFMITWLNQLSPSRICFQYPCEHCKQNQAELIQQANLELLHAGLKRKFYH